MKKSSILLILVLFYMVSTAAAAPTDGYIATITVDGTKNVSFADHTDSMLDGNWIYLSGGTDVKLPDPISFTYNGINESTYTYNEITVDLKLNIDEYSDHVISYPYPTHPMYTDVEGQNNVNMAFRGSTYFADEAVDVYLLSPSRASLTDAFNEVTKGNTTSIDKMLDTAHQKYPNQPLDSNGNMELNFGNLGAGDYAVLVLLNDTYLENVDDMSILSATAFEVLEYDSTLEAPSSVVPDADIDVNMTLLNAPETSSYTYGAILIHEDAYEADMVLNCNGTKSGTNFTLNGESLVEAFGLVGLDIHNLNQNDMMTIVTNLMVEGDTMYGTVVIESTSTNQSTLSLTTMDLPQGNYILLVGVYEPGNYLAAFQQSVVTIASQPVEPTAILSGIVTSPYGTPINGATVSIDGKSANTDTNGYYEIEAISYGTQAISASKLNYIKNSTSLNIDSLYEIFDFILTPTKATITGTVVDENGKPIPGAMVKIFAKPTLIVETSANTTSLGKFTAYVPADEEGKTYKLMVSAPYYTSTDKENVTVYPGQTTTFNNNELVLYNNKAEMRLAEGEKLKFAEANENASFRLSITNYGEPAQFDITYSGDATVNLDKSQAELGGSGSETIIVNVTDGEPGTYPVTITAKDSAKGKSASFEIVTVIKNSTIVYTDITANVDANTTVTNGSVILGNSNITQNATIANGSVVDSEVSGDAAEVNNSVVMEGAVVNNSKVLEGSVVAGSTITNATVTEGSSVENSDIGDGSQLSNTTATNTTATNTNVENATLTNVVASNSRVEGVELSNVTIENATVVSNNGEAMITSGSITTKEKIKFKNVYRQKNVKDLVLGSEPNNKANNGTTKIDKKSSLGVYLTQNSTESGNVSLFVTSISPDDEPNLSKGEEVVGNILVIKSDIPNDKITRTEIRIYLDNSSIKENFDALTITYQDPSTGDLIELEDCTTGYDEEIGKWYVSGYTTHYSTFMIVGENDTEESSSSGSSSDGSRSVNGGGTTGEPYDNIELRDVATNLVTEGSVVKFTFTNPDSNVQYVGYRALTNAGYTITTIEQLKDTSTYVKESAENMVYKNVNIWVVYKNFNILVGRPGYASEDYIDDAVVGFKVDKNWVEENNIEISSIRMNHYHEDVWNALSTTLIDEDEEYLYFEADTPGFSPFAITGIQKTTSAGEDVTGTDTGITQPGTETQEPGEEPESSIGKYVGGLVALLIIGGTMLGFIRTRKYK